ncbi:type II toxin-antitoxin system VapB family antitoxin [Alterisphingorhabdus coralli]|uniref:Type II toxin-antitoxin system VapB family antitoxin n=1 Tax=Alterisphingorhabdus coralli TaxID=3071408 RepID=A0AA97I0Y9_9SPHN|nr:type II toxin-antitoxin system VapB family antitoxin [Parasphingorhabdus sp. SCSIO 66989]WOE76189.1 type II toxin-antitoxin system VapB family antitoxin [Parasphingorhabdus sp. SCSIO 66989]
MALSIKDKETDTLVRRLARVRGISFTAAIRLAVSNELQRQAHRVDDDWDKRWAAIRAVQQKTAALPVLDDRADDAFLGYDDHGLPQ